MQLGSFWGVRMVMGRASHSGAWSLDLVPGVTCPYPCATLASQSGVSRGQGSHDSEP